MGDETEGSTITNFFIRHDYMIDTMILIQWIRYGVREIGMILTKLSLTYV